MPRKKIERERTIVITCSYCGEKKEMELRDPKKPPKFCGKECNSRNNGAARIWNREYLCRKTLP